jgi:hypothetical protein
MDYKEEFINIYKTNIRREGSDELMKFLCSKRSDFFKAPASSRYHNSYEGGLVEHSVNTYYCLKDYLSRTRVKEVYNYTCDDETIAIVALLHDLCKINCYKESTRNTKDEKGVWIQVPFYEYEDELPYGHGEKSVYIISGYMKLTRDEAFAIRFHMGFSRDDDKRDIANAFQRFPLALALFIADMEATYLMKENM